MEDSEDGSVEEFIEKTRQKGQENGRKREIENQLKNKMEVNPQLPPEPRYLQNTEASRRRAVTPSQHFVNCANHKLSKVRRRYRGGIEGGGRKQENGKNNSIKYPLIFYSSHYNPHEKVNSGHPSFEHVQIKSQHQNKKRAQFFLGYRTPVNSPCTSSTQQSLTTIIPDDPCSVSNEAVTSKSEIIKTSTKSKSSTATQLTTFLHINSKIRPIQNQVNVQNYYSSQLKKLENFNCSKINMILNNSESSRVTAYVYYDPPIQNVEVDYEAPVTPLEFQNRPKAPPRQWPPLNPHDRPKIKSDQDTRKSTRNRIGGHQSQSEMRSKGPKSSLVGEVIYQKMALPKTKSKVLNGQYVIVSRLHNKKSLSKKLYRNGPPVSENLPRAQDSIGYLIKVPDRGEGRHDNDLIQRQINRGMKTQSCTSLTRGHSKMCKIRKTMSDCHEMPIKMKQGYAKTNFNGLDDLLKCEPRIDGMGRVGRNLILWMAKNQEFATWCFRQNYPASQFTPIRQNPMMCQQGQWRTFDCTPSNHLTGCGACQGSCSRPVSPCQCPPSCPPPCCSYSCPPPQCPPPQCFQCQPEVTPCCPPRSFEGGTCVNCVPTQGCGNLTPPSNGCYSLQNNNCVHYISSRPPCVPCGPPRQKRAPLKPPPLPPKPKWMEDDCEEEEPDDCPPPPPRAKSKPPAECKPGQTSGGWPGCYPGMACMLLVPMCAPQCPPQSGDGCGTQNERQDRGRKRKYRQRLGFS